MHILNWEIEPKPAINKSNEQLIKKACEMEINFLSKGNVIIKGFTLFALSTTK